MKLSASVLNSLLLTGRHVPFSLQSQSSVLGCEFESVASCELRFAIEEELHY